MVIFRDFSFDQTLDLNLNSKRVSITTVFDQPRKCWGKEKRYRNLNIFRSFNRRICNAKKLLRNVLRERGNRAKISFSIDFIHKFFRRVNIGFELEGFSSVKMGQSFVFASQISFTWLTGWSLLCGLGFSAF